MCIGGCLIIGEKINELAEKRGTIRPTGQRGGKTTAGQNEEGSHKPGLSLGFPGLFQ